MEITSREERCLRTRVKRDGCSTDYSSPDTANRALSPTPISFRVQYQHIRNQHQPRPRHLLFPPLLFCSHAYPNSTFMSFPHPRPNHPSLIRHQPFPDPYLTHPFPRAPSYTTPYPKPSILPEPLSWNFWATDTLILRPPNSKRGENWKKAKRSN